MDIDIFGIDRDGKRVIGQVTHSKHAADLSDKQSRLLRHARDTDSIYFFLPEEAPLIAEDRVELVAFRKVLEDLEKDQDVSTRAMLREMFAEYS